MLLGAAAPGVFPGRGKPCGLRGAAADSRRGVVSARRILAARRVGPLRIEQLPKLGVVMKRAQYFLTASGRLPDGLRFTQDSLLRSLISLEQSRLPEAAPEQLSLFDNAVS